MEIKKGVYVNLKLITMIKVEHNPTSSFVKFYIGGPDAMATVGFNAEDAVRAEALASIAHVKMGNGET